MRIGWGADICASVLRELCELKPTGDEIYLTSWYECAAEEKNLNMLASVIGTAMKFPVVPSFCENDFEGEFVNVNLFGEEDVLPHYCITVWLEHGEKDCTSADIELLRGCETVLCPVPMSTEDAPWKVTVDVLVFPLNCVRNKKEIPESPQMFTVLTSILGCIEKSLNWNMKKIGKNCWRFQNWID